MAENLVAGKTVLITGASSGIGRQTAIYFSQQGARVIITGRNIERLQQTLSGLEGGNGLALIANLDSSEEVESLVAEAVQKAGPLDAVVHCAGVQKTLPLKILKNEDFDSVFNTNVKSAQFLAKSVVRKGRFNPSGLSLVFLSSVAAVCGESAISTYAASKAALQGLSRALAVELSKNKIRVNCISPGHIKTEMAVEFSQQLTVKQYKAIADKHPLGLGLPEYVSHAAAFLASDLSEWITGTILYVDGGYSAH